MIDLDETSIPQLLAMAIGKSVVLLPPTMHSAHAIAHMIDAAMLTPDVMSRPLSPVFQKFLVDLRAVSEDDTEENIAELFGRCMAGFGEPDESAVRLLQ